MATAYSSITDWEDQILEHARLILTERLHTQPFACTNVHVVQQFLTCWFAQEERQVFCALWLDAQHRLIAAENLFVGTLTHIPVYPREVIKRALQHNAASVIIAHNHPGGVAKPDINDEMGTATLKHALATVEVRLLDHLIIAGHEACSLAALGKL